jgi:hypothetical protein
MLVFILNHVFIVYELGSVKFVLASIYLELSNLYPCKGILIVTEVESPKSCESPDVSEAGVLPVAVLVISILRYFIFGRLSKIS